MQPEDFVRFYEKALATQDWKYVSPVMHTDCVVTFSDGTIHKGKSQIRAAFERNFEQIENEYYRISDIHWVVRSEQFAVFTFRYSWSGIVGDKLASSQGRGTSSILCTEQRWQLTSEHLGTR